MPTYGFLSTEIGRLLWGVAIVVVILISLIPKYLEWKEKRRKRKNDNFTKRARK